MVQPKRNTWLLVFILFMVLLGINNTVYYYFTKQTLEDRLDTEMVNVAKQIEIAIEQSRTGAELFEQQLGRELRLASIAAQYALDPDVEKVTNEQLAELSRKLDILHITLLKRTKGDIVLYKSSDPEDIGHSTSTWVPWHQAFNQLFDKHDVSIEWGQSLKNFWTGPYEVATSDTSSVRKWGYYYDGTTNYILDPYISYDAMEAYQRATGVDGAISRILKENPTVLEITAINPSTFPYGPVVTRTPDGKELDHITQAPIIYGSYKYKDGGDIANVEKAYRSNQVITLDTVINGKHVMKKFIPVSIDKVTTIVDLKGQPLGRYVLTVVSDYATIKDTLDRQFIDIGLIIALVTLLSLLIVWFVLVNLRKSRDRAVRAAQETYVDEINQLFRTVRAQRHDFLNHVQTIHSLAELDKVEELKIYAKELTGEIQVLNDIINIGNPAIAALVRAKISQASSLRIRFQADFNIETNLELGVKSLDLTRLIGNLIDNAFDEVMRYPEDKRIVSLEGGQEQRMLVLSVTNYSEHGQALKGKPIFEPGYSSKGEEHQGLGLSIVKSIVEEYGGSIALQTECDHQVRFLIRIPL